MKELEEAILSRGTILPGEVLKVGSFLNQQVDITLLSKMADDVVNHFGKDIDKVLTIEASGIPFATAIALKLNVPLVFAKKSMSSNVSGDVVTSKAASFTHNQVNTIILPKEYIKENENVLIVDDFLAKGEASKALVSIALQCMANIKGIAIQIEKEFQGGGNELRALGYDVYSLAKIASMSKNNIIFK